MDTNKMCRCCLALRCPLFSIFDRGTAVCGCVADMMRAIADVDPRPNDDMPQKACLQCICEISRSYIFKTKCENSDKTLRQLKAVATCGCSAAAQSESMKREQDSNCSCLPINRTSSEPMCYEILIDEDSTYRKPSLKIRRNSKSADREKVTFTSEQPASGGRPKKKRGSQKGDCELTRYTADKIVNNILGCPHEPTSNYPNKALPGYW